MDSTNVGRSEGNGVSVCGSNAVETLSPKTVSGTKVRYAFPNNGYTHEQKVAKFLLNPHRIYTVDFLSVGPFHTDVYLKEMPGERFNSVFFAEVPDPEDVEKF